jgi:hypothetical protein
MVRAEANYRRALGLYRRQLANGHPDRAAAATGLGRCCSTQGGRPRPSVTCARDCPSGGPDGRLSPNV